MTREEIRKRMDELARQDSAYSRADYDGSSKYGAAESIIRAIR